MTVGQEFHGETMTISAMEEYGLRCALQLARSRLVNGVLPASQIAESEGISIEYVSKILFFFRRSGLVTAVRGSQGGFKLALDPSSVPVKAVFDAVKGKKQNEAGRLCTQYRGQNDHCTHLGDCSIRPVWDVLGSYFDGVLRALTLGDLLSKEQDVSQRMHLLAATQANRVKNQLERKNAL